MAAILIPLFFILASIVGILFITFKKMPYLRKLVAEESGDNGGFLENMFPKMAGNIKKARWDKNKEILAKEFEKFFRRLHVMSLKFDNFTNKILRKLKTKNSEFKKENSGQSIDELKKEAPSAAVSKEELLKDLKKEEQRLIMEITKNPKNPEPYKELGDAYVKMGSAGDAKDSYAVAVELDPEDLVTKNKLDKIVKKK